MEDVTSPWIALRPDAAAIPGRALRDKKLSIGAVGLLAYVIYATDGKDLTWGEVRDRFGLTDDEIGLLDKEIEEAGYYLENDANDQPANNWRPEPPVNRRKRSSIYVITDGSLTKVGISRKVKKRLSVIRTSCSNSAIDLAFSQEEDEPVVMRAEALSHRYLRAHHSHGEWFRVGPDAAIEAVMKALKCARKAAA